MIPFKKIVVLHPGAIGDVTLATPVAVALKSNFPDAQLTYWTHSSLSEFVGLCAAIDRVVGYDKQDGIWQLRRTLGGMAPDLVVDLAGSSRSRWLTVMCGARVVRYAKQPQGVLPIVHAAENFLDTLEPLSVRLPEKPFPTLSGTEGTSARIRQLISGSVTNGKALVGLVPGVGNLRPHRAWIEEGWVYAACILLRSERYIPVLIGGAKETELCERIVRQVDEVVPGCVNVAGKISLAETAAALKLCRAVVSGDTGPAHIAVAVGTPVVGLYGPTLPERSGPYGYEKLVVSESHRCRCRDSKACTVPGITGPGQCMRGISLEQVCDKLRIALQDENL